MRSFLVYLFASSVCALCIVAVCAEIEVVEVVVPGERSFCLVHDLRTNEVAELSYSVVKGNALEIDFTAYSPVNSILVFHQNREDGFAKVVAKETGPYQFCFSNNVPRQQPKTVMFGMNLITDKQKSEVMDQGLYSNIWKSTTRIENGLDILKDIHDHCRTTEHKSRSLLGVMQRRIMWRGFYIIVFFLSLCAFETAYVHRVFREKRQTRV